MCEKEGGGDRRRLARAIPQDLPGVAATRPQGAAEPTQKITAEFEPTETLIVDLSPAAELEIDMLSPEEAMEVGIHPAAYRGESGKAPKISEDGYWLVWNNDTEAWEDTGVYARGINNYDELTHKPSINDVELMGNKTSRQLGLENKIANADIAALFGED